MKIKTREELYNMVDAVRTMNRASAMLYEAGEKLLSVRVRGLCLEIDAEVTKWDVVCSDIYKHSQTGEK